MATNNRLIEQLANRFRRRRLSLLEDIAGSQRAARALIEERGSEIEENAQKDRITSLVSYLNGRDQKMIQQIDATLKRIDEGTYGQCDCARTKSVGNVFGRYLLQLFASTAQLREKNGSAPFRSIEALNG